jgi:hypothetical protein
MSAMPLTLDHGGIRLAVDGDVLDAFMGTTTERIPLSRLAVRLDRRGKERVQVAIQLANDPGEPLYAWGWAPTVKGYLHVIEATDEPVFREFFTEVAAQCGREVPPAPDPAAPKRRRWGKS